MATNNKPANRLRCSNIKATIWQNVSEKGRINPGRGATGLRSVSVNLEALVTVAREAKEWISAHALKG
jgi:hypothetical protein